MKLKLLSLFLALGMFAFGASVKADDLRAPAKQETNLPEERVEAPGDIFGSLLCSALNKYIPDQSTWPQVCKDACAGSPPLQDMGCCVKQMALANNSNHPNVQKAIAAVKATCGATLSPVCSGKNYGINGTCNNATVRKACGYVCCNIDPTTVTKCMSSYNDNCSNYQAVTCASERLKATW